MANRIKKNQKKDRFDAMNTHSQRARKHGWCTYIPARYRKTNIRKRGNSFKEYYADLINSQAVELS